MSKASLELVVSNPSEKLANTGTLSPKSTSAQPAKVGLTSNFASAEKIGHSQQLSILKNAVLASLDAETFAFIQNAPAMKLRDRFVAEANSHRNMLARAAKQGKMVHLSIIEFREFLMRIGPMPSAGMTLDRIDNCDPEYAPGKIRWADKKVQNNNKSDTQTYTISSGLTYTTSQLAELHSVSTDAIRKRRAQGWTNDEIFLGKRLVTSSNNLVPPGKTAAALKFPNGLYTPKQLALLSGSEAQLTYASDIEFYRTAHSHQHYRTTEQEEFLVMTPDEHRENYKKNLELLLAKPSQDHATFRAIVETRQLMSLPNASLDRAWLRHWRKHRAHTVYELLTAEYKAYVAKIDPQWVARQMAKQSVTQEDE
ncbi:hypothetical protein GJW-30_1_00050 [Variibacter gotjawalensis]|uniref:Uncharacterized protein n=1 Tax=Variibacter gotjawalensis TaxID=1333996 RepID=A0A0S3PNL5_9BRAD|nr:hypothetical protein [Variibacter gotjawalensis]NIK47828.1 hypothetical protein [Variibacter gotjawalensis]RZS49715.1 hypothetical protein EV661_2155 [Variibacter gotjawalensis]BAT57544.1 hypothetical protein GJW-30_1_00050 [Variibacter gotjawalensis]